LIQRYFTEPYRFIPPYRSKFWCRVFHPVVKPILRRSHGVTCCRFEGAEHLSRSLERGAGILLVSNHCRRADPIVLSTLGLHVKRYFYYVVAYHQFKQSRLFGWLIHRLGGYSLWREGVDRESLRTSIQILAEAERPMVLFPEGTWFRQNDCLGPIQDGLALIARHAARQASRPIVIHPVAIKYWLLEDPRLELARRLEALEARLSWSPQRHLDLVPRLEKLASAYLGIKEVEQGGVAQTGPLDERIQGLADAHVTLLEKKHLDSIHGGWILERIRRLRQILVRHLGEAGDEGRIQSVRQDLELLMFCENLAAHSAAYLRERPSLERLTETVQRIEETVRDDLEVPVAPAGAVVAVGPALEVPSQVHRRREDSDPLVRAVASGIQGLLDQLLSKGPPPDWNCPPPVELLPVSELAAASPTTV
jgi:hypothetical protein